MNLFYNGQNFPRRLTEIEEYWLYKILPDNKLGYKIYREKIKYLYVIGYGKFPPFNLILGDKNDKPDLSIPSQSIFATGAFLYKIGKVDVSIFEEFENQIEIDIQSDGFYYYDVSPVELINREEKFFSYSDWVPGKNHPYDNSELRSIEIEEAKILLVISSLHKRVWIYDYYFQTNKFIPITNFYQELLKISNMHDSRIITDINYFFLNLNKFSDSQIKAAFINYNRNWKKVELSQPVEMKEVKKNFFKKIIKRFLWKK